MSKWFLSFLVFLETGAFATRPARRRHFPPSCRSSNSMWEREKNVKICQKVVFSFKGGGRPRMPGAAEQQPQSGEQQSNKKVFGKCLLYFHFYKVGEDQRGPGALRREEKLPAKLPRLHQDKDGRKGTYINELSSQYRHGIPGHAGGQGYDPPSPSLRMPL